MLNTCRSFANCVELVSNLHGYLNACLYLSACCRNSVSGDNQAVVTRFIAMGNYGNPDKANKGMYAFSIEPMVTMEKADLCKIPEGTTESPYSQFHSQTQVLHCSVTISSPHKNRN